MVYKPGYCPMCNAIPSDLKCTLHGGQMTATEVRMRHRYEIVKNRWKLRPSTPNPLAEAFRPMVDAIYDLLKRVK